MDSRFEDFAESVVVLFRSLPKSFGEDYLAKQRIRSACSSELNFGKFEGAGSDKDRANELKIALKELPGLSETILFKLKLDL